MTPRVLATCPGKFGDLLWSMPTLRALAEAYDTPVDLQISAAYGSLAPLLIEQPYIGAVLIDTEWAVRDTAPMTPRIPPRRLAQADQVYHLGYEGWPEPTLAFDIFRRTVRTFADRHGSEAYSKFSPVNFDRPWITTRTRVAPPDWLAGEPSRVWVAWSEEWFELKVGILVSLAIRFRDRLTFRWVRPFGGRYDEVDQQRGAGGDVVGAGQVDVWDQQSWLGSNVEIVRTDWVGAAAEGAGCQVYLGCLSSQWVLANGLGKGVIAVEPNAARHHPVFYRESLRNHLVTGNDGLATFDSRHVGDALEAWLKEQTR